MGARSEAVPVPHNKQLERAVIRHRMRAASAPFHYALAARWTAQRAAAQLRR
jgi:predicted N-formylglutamate amidohydrolase